MFAAAVAKYLAAQGLLTFGTVDSDCFLEELPAVPVNAVAVKTLSTGPADLMPWGPKAVQLIVRADGVGGRARSGHDRIMALKQVLHGLRHTTLDAGGVDETRVIVAVAATEEPVDLGVDSNDLPRWGLVVEATCVLSDGVRFDA